MYAFEERRKAVDLYEANGHNVQAVIETLGYPNRTTLYRWVAQAASEPKKLHPGRASYTLEQKQQAVEFYLHNGRSMAFTMRALGYPTNKDQLRCWIDRYAPNQRRTTRGPRANSYVEEEAILIKRIEELQAQIAQQSK
jgi:transposase-like protein